MLEVARKVSGTKKVLQSYQALELHYQRRRTTKGECVELHTLHITNLQSVNARVKIETFCPYLVSLLRCR